MSETPAMIEDAPDPSSYTLGKLLRHIPLSLSRMRRVVREMRDAGAGWGAFAAISALSMIVVLAEIAFRDPARIRNTLEEARTGAISALEMLWTIGWPSLQWPLVSVLLVFVWLGTARLLGRPVTLRQSVVGVAAGGLPAIAFSLLISLAVFPARAALGDDGWASLLGTIDWVVPIALWGYGVVAWAAATRLGLFDALMIQLVGVIGFALLLFGALSLAGLAFDQGIGWLVRLVLG